MHTGRTTPRWFVALSAAVPLLWAAATPLGAQLGSRPQGWQVFTDAPGTFSVGTVPETRPGGTGWVVATIKPARAAVNGSAYLQQSIRADAYRGQRVRLAGWMRTAPETLAQLWMRVDGEDGTLASDFMLDRPLFGAREWASYSIVLDVPRDAVGITFGLAMVGAGQTWLDDVTLESVGPDVATTAPRPGALGGAGPRGAGVLSVLPWRDLRNIYRTAPLQPANLDFEQGRVIAIR